MIDLDIIQTTYLVNYYTNYNIHLRIQTVPREGAYDVDGRRRTEGTFIDTTFDNKALMGIKDRTVRLDDIDKTESLREQLHELLPKGVDIQPNQMDRAISLANVMLANIEAGKSRGYRRTSELFPNGAVANRTHGDGQVYGYLQEIQPFQPVEELPVFG